MWCIFAILGRYGSFRQGGVDHPPPPPLLDPLPPSPPPPLPPSPLRSSNALPPACSAPAPTPMCHAFFVFADPARPHGQEYQCTVKLEGCSLNPNFAVGVGHSRKHAEQNAAMSLMTMIQCVHCLCSLSPTVCHLERH